MADDDPLKQLPFRVRRSMAEQIEAARGDVPRETWLRNLVKRELDEPPLSSAKPRSRRNPRDPAVAHAVVLRAVREGDLIRPDVCSRCGKAPNGKGKIHAHHPDYDRPLDVEWLCPACHRLVPPGENSVPSDFVMVRLPGELAERIKKAGHKREPFVRIAVEAALNGSWPPPTALPSPHMRSTTARHQDPGMLARQARLEADRARKR